MSKISFESTESVVRFMNPLKEFAEDAQTIQVRRDPLLGDTSIFNPELKDKAQIFFGSCDQALIDKLVEETAKSCFFLRCSGGKKYALLYPRFFQ